jgi:hypothetical protein
MVRVVEIIAIERGRYRGCRFRRWGVLDEVRSACTPGSMYVTDVECRGVE